MNNETHSVDDKIIRVVERKICKMTKSNISRNSFKILQFNQNSVLIKYMKRMLFNVDLDPEDFNVPENEELSVN